MSKPPLKVADGEPVEQLVTVVLIPGTQVLTEDFYGVTLGVPVKIRVPMSAIESIDEVT